MLPYVIRRRQRFTLSKTKDEEVRGVQIGMLGICTTQDTLVFSHSKCKDLPAKNTLLRASYLLLTDDTGLLLNPSLELDLGV